MLVTLATSQFEMSPLNDVAQRNMLDMSFAVDTSHFEMSPLNDVAAMNTADMPSTLDTSHFEMSPLKKLALANMRLMSVTRDTSHSPTVPCGPLEESPFGYSVRHAPTALFSSAFDCGEYAGEGRRGAVWKSPKNWERLDSKMAVRGPRFI